MGATPPVTGIAIRHDNAFCKKIYWWRNSIFPVFIKGAQSLEQLPLFSNILVTDAT